MVTRDSPEKVSFLCLKCGLIFTHEFHPHMANIPHEAFPLTCPNINCKTTDLLRLGRVKDGEV